LAWQRTTNVPNTDTFTVQSVKVLLIGRNRPSLLYQKLKAFIVYSYNFRDKVYKPAHKRYNNITLDLPPSCRCIASHKETFPLSFTILLPLFPNFALFPARLSSLLDALMVHSYPFHPSFPVLRSRFFCIILKCNIYKIEHGLKAEELRYASLSHLFCLQNWVTMADKMKSIHEQSMRLFEYYLIPLPFTPTVFSSIVSVWFSS
jgi:hypothetical protein